MWKSVPEDNSPLPPTARGLRPQRASFSSGENQPSGGCGKRFEADILQMCATPVAGVCATRKRQIFETLTFRFRTSSRVLKHGV
jgi:hypothetical protein